MQFRVTSIQDEGLPESFNDARLWLEDWLNKTIGNSDFGRDDASIVIVVFSTSSLQSEPVISRLSTSANGSPFLALHIVVDPESVQKVVAEEHLRLLCTHVAKGLPLKPLRNPKGLDYPGLRKALLASIQPLAECA